MGALGKQRSEAALKSEALNPKSETISNDQKLKNQTGENAKRNLSHKPISEPRHYKH